MGQSRRPSRDDESSQPRRSARRQALADQVVPTIGYPPLPVAERRDDLLAALREHQVVVVAGETGSGKTTQLPKMCLELGRGVAGAIGHTQPRRIAARAVAERIAEELGVELGGVVGYQVRFTQRATRDTLVKVMTDGVLLAEIAQDPLLHRYDTLILDEAHERSLNIDFLLGYLARLLPRRPDLKVVITSATIDVERFSRHFGGAPVVEVTGRVYPVEVRYRPLTEPLSPDDEDDSAPAAPRDQVQGICEAVEELAREGPGDVLVFLSGEREIRDAADALRALDLRDTEVLPLYGRLSAAEQHRVFTPHTGRRIVLATNVAETSLTVPGIRYVVDPGTARISRYSQRLKVQRLPIEPISQASARQRAGRCGRLEDGVCIRLYSEADHDGRPEFTEPEILRTSLASVILRMADLRLGEVAAFPFLDPPDPRQIASGVQLLEELGALDPQSGPDLRLTETGRRMARVPVDPRLARMLVAADGEGCLREVLVIVAALSVQDPRERPTDAQEAADEQHRRFADPRSDFLAYLNLWAHLKEQQRVLSGNAFRRMCRREFLNYLRVREWQDLHAQLRQIADDLGMVRNGAPAEPDAVHRALLTGLLSHVGVRIERDQPVRPARGGRDAGRRRPRREYEGARGIAVRDRAGVGAGQGGPGGRDGRRARRDQPAVGSRRRGHPSRVGRGARGPPGDAVLLRAALGPAAGRGDGLRAGHPLRRHAHRRPTRAVRAGRPGWGPRAVPAARAGAGGVAHPPRLRQGERPPPPRGRGGRAPGPPPRAARRRRGAVRLLRRAGARRHRVDAPLRPVVEVGADRDPRPADPAAWPCCCRRRTRTGATGCRTCGCRATSGCRWRTASSPGTPRTA